MHVRTLLPALALCLAAALPALAQTAPPTRIRGTIEAVDAHTLTVKSRDGQTIPIMLNDPLTVLSLKKVDLASVAPGTFIGTASAPAGPASRSRSWSSPKPPAAPARATTPGISSPAA